MESLAEEVDVKEILTLVASSSHKSLFNLSLCFYLNSNIVDEEKGIECLAKATSKGHKAAAYLCGVISLVRGGEVAQKSIEIFKSSFVVKSSALKTRRNLQEFPNIKIILGELGSFGHNCVRHGQSFIWEKDDCPLECESCLLYTENAAFVFFSHRPTEKIKGQVKEFVVH
ncbi:unnamed protein product [Arabidopsis lyrata]|nr:unnamed protein product [Arabidopsis lyrata]